MLEAAADDSESDIALGLLENRLAARPIRLAGRLKGVVAGRVPTPEPLAVGVEVLDVLGRMQRRAPVIVFVDDAQWADRPSLAIRVMTRNLYLGADLSPLLAAQTVPEFFGAVTQAFATVPPVELQAGDLTLRYAEWGPMAIRHAHVPAQTDMSPVLEGLPDDRCPSPHWGIVLEGSIHLRHWDGAEETVRAGEMYYWPAGHTAWTDEDVVFVEVGPVEPMRQFSRHARQKVGS